MSANSTTTYTMTQPSSIKGSPMSTTAPLKVPLSDSGDYNVLVQDLLGPCLESLFESTLRKFSLKTVLMLMDQMISRI